MATMKSETLEEARDRLIAMSDAEKEGASSVAEGQLQPDLGTPTAPGSVEARLLERAQADRTAPSTNDMTDEGQGAVPNTDAGTPLPGNQTVQPTGDQPQTSPVEGQAITSADVGAPQPADQPPPPPTFDQPPAPETTDQQPAPEPVDQPPPEEEAPPPRPPRSARRVPRDEPEA